MQASSESSVRRGVRVAQALALIAALGAAAGAQGDADARTLIHAGRLIDGVSDEARARRTVIVAGERIEAIRRGFVEPAEGDAVVDLSGATVMPGLVDAHVHIATERNPDTAIERYRLDPADRALRAATYARRTLAAGFTTVRDLGTVDGVALDLRDAIADGWVQGPRIFAAGKSIATTGGHADPTNGARRDLFAPPRPPDGVADGPVELREAVRWRYKRGADLVKITATGGVLSEAASGRNPQLTVEEVREVVRTARDYGFHVAAHAHGAEGMRRAVLGGVTSIEHGTFMTDEIMDLMIERGTVYVPTILAGRFVAEKAREPGYFSERVRPKAEAIGPRIDATFARAYAAGVPIVFGTDSGVSPHGENWKEFVYMVEGGMPAMEAIRAATLRAAELLGVAERLGSIEPGKIADLVAVDGDPLAEIERMGDVRFVMKAGSIFRRDG